MRVNTAADALRPGGLLATIATHHVDGGDAQFFIDVQACYRRWFPESPGVRLPAAAEIPADSADLDHSGPFEPPTFRRYEWEQRYTARQYLDLLSTYSDHRALDQNVRRHLLECTSQLIVERYGDRIRKRYLNELRVAHRRAR